MKFLRNKTVATCLLLCAITLTLLIGLGNDYNKKKETRIEQITKLLIKNEKEPRAFCPPEYNRKFWNAIKEKPPAEKPPEVYKKGWELKTIQKGTLQECIYNTGDWIPIIEKNMEEILKIPWRERIFKKEFVDLSTTTTAAELAFTCAMLKDKLNKKLVENVKKTIEEKVFKPFLNETKERQKRKLSWVDDLCGWLENKDNWTSVCCSNITYAALAIINDPKKRAEIIAATEDPLKNYFQSFEEDGYLPSGIRYWKYGYQHFVFMAERLLKATDGEINLYNQYPATKKAALYPIKLTIKEEGDLGYYPLFNDNANPTKKPTWVWNILEKRFILPFKPKKLNYAKIPEENIVKDMLLNPYKENRIKEKINTTPNDTFFFESNGVLISREKDFAFIIKGGNNQDEHNRNQIGAYTLFKDGDDVLGVVETLAYSLKNRNNRSLINSYGNPVPVVDKQLQKSEGINSSKIIGKVINKIITPEKEEITYDLTKAYQVESIKTLERKMTFDHKKKTITIADSFEAYQPIEFETAIITKQITKTYNGIIEIENKDVEVLSKGSTPLEIEQEKLKDAQDTKNKVEITRYAIKLKDKNVNGKIEYTIKLK